MPSGTITGVRSSFTLTTDSYVLTNLGTVGGNGVPVGLWVTSRADTVVNAGRLAGQNDGVYAYQDLSLTNQSGGLIDSSLGAGVGIYGGAGSVTNAGSIAGADVGVVLAGGGIVSNQSGGSITGGHDAIQITGGAGTVEVDNAGGISGALSGIVLYGGGSVINRVNGEIDGGQSFGIDIQSGTGTVINAGYINGAAKLASGVNLALGGSVTNQSAGTIAGDVDGIVASDGAQVTNAGYIYGQYAGVELKAAGLVTNLAGGVISSGGKYGVLFKGAAGTVTNAGSIAGVSDAVKFAAGFVNRLVLDPGALFTGTVDGGNTIGAAASSTLELASAATTGTLTGLGTQFANFANVAVDSLATWTIAGVIGGGTTLTNAGTINAPLTLAAGGVLSNVLGGKIAGPGIASAVRALSGGGATVINAGSIGGTTYGVTLAAGGYVTNLSGGLITGTARGITVEGGTGTVINAGTVNSDQVGVVLDAGGVVTNQSGGVITGITDRGVAVLNTAGTVVNAGSITAYLDGILLNGGGTITNQNSGTITSTNRKGVRIETNSGTVNNAGGIAGYGDGVFLRFGGTVTNQSGGTISQSSTSNIGSYAAIAILSGAATVDNAGIVSAWRDGVYLMAGGTVTNETGGSISSTNLYGIQIKGALGRVVNAGTIIGPNDAIELRAGGTVTNQSTGTIIGTDNSTGRGVEISGTTGSVDNAGRISGGEVGVLLAYGGAVLFNRAGATISQSGGTLSNYSYSGVVTELGSGTITNAGSIVGDYNGIGLTGGGIITNMAGGEIRSVLGVGVALRNGTLVNAGSISGATYAVKFRSGFAERLVIDPGASFSGTVEGGNTIGAAFASTLELAAGAAAGSLSGIGVRYIDFANITVDKDATWSLYGQNSFAAGVTLTDAGTLTVADLIGAATATIQDGATLNVAGTVADGETVAFGGASGLLTVDAPASVKGSVTGFVVGDTIDLAGVDPASISLVSGTLHFISGGTAASFGLGAGHGSLTANSDNDGGALVSLSVACFASGTGIWTTRGNVPVDALRDGDRVLTWSGEERAIVWIGQRHIDITRHADPTLVRPIRIRSHAVAANVPHRDLIVSPDHALFIDGMLIPARRLVNGGSIVVDMECRSITYFHIELERHDILLAEGLSAESYLDTGNRSMFENTPGPMRLHPDFSGDQRLRESGSCAPFASEAAQIEPVWRTLARRSVMLDWELPEPPVLVDDPDLCLMAGTRRLKSITNGDGRYTFVIPRGDTPLRLMSRAARPSDIRPWIEDRRLLGVLVRRMILRTEADVREVVMDGPLPERGWWAVEWQMNRPCRWTNGEAMLPPLGRGVLELELAGKMRYRIGNAPPSAQKVRGGGHEKRNSRDRDIQNVVPRTRVA